MQTDDNLNGGGENYHQGTTKKGYDFLEFTPRFKIQTDSLGRELDRDDGNILDVIDLLNGLTSDDPEVTKCVMAKAEELMRNELLLDGGGDSNPQLTFDPASSCQNEPKQIDFKAEEFFEDLTPEEMKARKGTRTERKMRSDVFRQSGNACCSKKDYEEAVRCYTEAIDLIRDSPCLYNNRAQVYIQLGRCPEAIKDCNRAISLTNSSLRGRLYKAKALFMNGQHFECLACLRETREILPAYTRAIDHCQQQLFGAGLDEELKLPRTECDVFPTESFIRHAANYDMAKMSTFFEVSPLARTERRRRK